MSESLWNDIDERLRGQLDAYMGRASAFPTLKLQTVEASILTDLLQMDWKKREFPFGIVDGRVEEMNLREHGDDPFSANGESRYKYFIACAVMGSRAVATRDAKILDAAGWGAGGLCRAQPQADTQCPGRRRSVRRPDGG